MVLSTRLKVSDAGSADTAVYAEISLESKRLVFVFLVQHECIPQAILGMDILCQAKSGMGKTAVFVLATLQQIEPVDGQVSVVLMFCFGETVRAVRYFILGGFPNWCL